MRIDAIIIGERYRHKMGDIDGLAQSIAEVGLLHPIVVTPDGHLIAGARRTEACKRLGWTDIPATVVDLDDIMRGETAENVHRKDFTPTEAVAIGRALDAYVATPVGRPPEEMVQNLHHLEQGKTRDKVGAEVGMSGFTYDKAKAVVSAAEREPEKFGDLPEMMDAKSVDRAYKELRTRERKALLDEAGAQDVPPENTGYPVRYGDVWQAGEHLVICGDCGDPAIMAYATDIHMILNDPPYGMGLDTDYSKLPSTREEGNRTYAPIIGDDRPFAYDTFGVSAREEFWFGADYYAKTLPDGGSWLVWDKRVDEKFDAMIGSAFELIWSKTRHKREIIRCNMTLFSGDPEARNKAHPTQKPTRVIAWIIERYSSPGDRVLDMYLGSGTTLIVCERLQRRCLGIEIAPEHVAIALARWAQESGGIPERIGRLELTQKRGIMGA